MSPPLCTGIGLIRTMRRTISRRRTATFPAPRLPQAVAFAAGVAARHAFWGNCDWGRHNINVASRNVNINNFDRSSMNNFTKWEHNADHRHGVKYNNADVRQKFAKSDIQAGKAARQDFRGKDGQKVLEPDRGRAGAGERPAAGDRDRPAAGGRDRPDAGDRDRPQARDTGGRPETSKGGWARRARNRPRKLARRRARKRVSSQVRRPARGRANRSATPLFQMSNPALRLKPRLIVAAKAS